MAEHASLAPLSLSPLPRLPPEIIALILHHLYYEILPPSSPFPNPDPHLALLNPADKAVHFAPSPADTVTAVFREIALVDSTWGREAQRYLWYTVGFGMPRGFEAVLRTVEEYRSGQQAHPTALRASGDSGWSLLSTSTDGGSEEAAAGRGRPVTFAVEDDKWMKMAGSGRRDGMMLDDANIPDSPRGTSTPAPAAPLMLNPADSPFLQTRVVSFSRFRTAGMRRSIRQGSHERFVTPQRLLTLLRGTRAAGPLKLPGDDNDVDAEVEPLGRLDAVGFSEFMDSAISRNVLEELLFRGGYLAEYEDEERPQSHDAYARSGGKEQEQDGPEKPFFARQLQSSLSRSRSPQIHESIDEQEPEDSVGSAVEEEEEEDEAEVAVSDDSPERPRGRRPVHPPLERRASGSAFRIPSINATARDDSEERGRARRLKRSLLPPSSLSNRAYSVPPVFLTGPPFPRSPSVSNFAHDEHERSASVPAAVPREDLPVARSKVIVRVLEGSVKVRAIRALDLCGCVSSTFVSALSEVITEHHLGPVGFFESSTSGITAIEERDAMEEDGDTTSGGKVNSASQSRKLRRIFFPHMRRLGLASALVPAPHLASIVLSFPLLTHLDLTFTLASPLLLFALASAGKTGLGGRQMRLQALSLARCRLLTGAALVGLLCGDCPPFTSMAGYGTGDDRADENWGSGEVVSELVDLSLYGDSTLSSPLSPPELRLILTNSPAFLSGRLRSLDLSSTPLTDAFLAAHFPPQPQLIELGLAHCRSITVAGVAALLLDKTPAVEVLDLSYSCPAPHITVASAQRRATTPATTISVMQLHRVLLHQVASVQSSSEDFSEAEEAVRKRKTNLRVVELNDKSLEAVQGGAGDWRPIWGKGRRGWYVDVGVASRRTTSAVATRPRELYALAKDAPRRRALGRLAELNGVVAGDVGWHSRKMEVLRGDGLMGRESGLYIFHAYQV